MTTPRPESGRGPEPSRPTTPPGPAAPPRVTPTLAAFADAPTLAPSPNAPPGQPARILPEVESGAERRIGHYTLRRLIGEGGMGVVYEAEQLNPRRIVALKIMRSGIASDNAARRFEYEAQLLARLRHPGIAQIYEAGTHTPPHPGALPIPFYAMEYIPGARILTDYARAADLTTRRRLELFARVCDAVHHGHTKGVIHRDLKPANILVDPAGDPKVIDFGVARAVEHDPSTPVVQTQPGVMVGTPQYMSPEQAAGGTGIAGGLDIDTRSDVYALGVILFELLSGELPYDLTGTHARDLTRIIREQPARRLSVATRSEVRGDAETIVHKALEKDRERRYQSAADLAADIRRYLAGEPIAARPPSVAYQIRVLARRHRALTAAAIIAITAIVAGGVASAIFAARAAEQRREAVAARDAARDEAARARRVTDFLASMLAEADPTNSQRTDMTVRELVDVAAGRLDTAFATDPDVSAQLRITLGQTLLRLGEIARAETMFRRARETLLASRPENDPESLNAYSLTGAALLLQGKAGEAEPILRDALDRQAAVLGEDHPDALSSLSNLALVVQDLGRLDESERIQRRALELKRRVHGPAHRETLTSLTMLSDLLQSMGRMDEAIAVARDASRACLDSLGPRDPGTLMAQSVLGSALFDAGKYEEAATISQTVYDTRVQVLGENHPETLTTLNTLALTHAALKRYDLAEQTYRRVFQNARVVLGPEHPVTISYTNNFANFIREQAGRAKLAGQPMDEAALDEAERLFRDALSVDERVRGADAVPTLVTVNNLAMLLDLRGRHADAEPLLRRVVAGVDKALPVEHWMRPASRKNLADCLVDLGRAPEAEPLLKQAYDDTLRLLGPEHERTRGCAKSLVELFEKTGRPELAEPWRPRVSGAP